MRDPRPALSLAGGSARGAAGRRVAFGMAIFSGTVPGGFLPPITASGSESGLKPRMVRSRSSGERRSPGSGAKNWRSTSSCGERIRIEAAWTNWRRRPVGPRTLP